MGQCASSSGKISVKKVMKNTITQFIDKTEYLVSSYDLLTDAYNNIKEEIFEIVHFGGNNGYATTNQFDENRIDYNSKQRTNSDGITEKSTLVVIMSLSSLPNIINNVQFTEKQSSNFIRIIERFQECVKCLRALRSSCCKALQRQEIGWQNYQIIQSSPTKKSSSQPEMSDKACCNSHNYASSPSKHSKSTPLVNQPCQKKKDVYNMKREICARKLLLIIQNIDQLQQSCDFDYIIKMVKQTLINKTGLVCKQSQLNKDNDDEEQVQKHIAAVMAQQIQKNQELLQNIIKDLSESEIL